MLTYKMTLEHDDGRVVITVTASSLTAAIEKVLKAEKAPERAIIAIRLVKDSKR